LADASVAPGDARAALAELRVWEGFPLDVRFARFRQAMRPRSVRLAERNAKRADSSGTAPGTDHDEPSLAFDPAIETELASAREDRIRLAAEGQRQTSVASAFAPGKALPTEPREARRLREETFPVEGDHSEYRRVAENADERAEKHVTGRAENARKRRTVRRDGRIEERDALGFAVLRRRRARGDARGG
jgi:hypothetical protein